MQELLLRNENMDVCCVSFFNACQFYIEVTRCERTKVNRSTPIDWFIENNYPGVAFWIVEYSTTPHVQM